MSCLIISAEWVNSESPDVVIVVWLSGQNECLMKQRKGSKDYVIRPDDEVCHGRNSFRGNHLDILPDSRHYYRGWVTYSGQKKIPEPDLICSCLLIFLNGLCLPDLTVWKPRGLRNIPQMRGNIISFIIGIQAFGETTDRECHPGIRTVLSCA